MHISLNDNFYKLHFGSKNFQQKNVLNPDELKLLDEYKKQYDYSRTKPIQWKTKRVLDVGLSSLGVIVSAPIMLLSAIAIKLDSKGPVLFKQKRVGQNGDIFTVLKFRTMINNPDINQNVQNADDKRITRVGKILRKYSIDEFPQFFNIIKGDMSLTGPRPLNVDNHEYRNLNKNFVIRYVFKPGASLDTKVTKLFVDNNPEFCNNIEQDYIQNWNLKKDFNICLKTIKKILLGDNY